MDLPQPKATLAIGPGAGFGFVLLFIFPIGEASVVAEGRGVALKVSVMVCETVALSACRGTNGSLEAIGDPCGDFWRRDVEGKVHGWNAILVYKCCFEVLVSKRS